MISHKTLANAIRMLSIDAIQRANSGHPGAPMGMADIAEVLWNDYMNHNPMNPKWINRDRFILSNGHSSMLLYSLLHLTGYNLSIEELKNFRQLHSKTPGHPEYGKTEGVETTTGPLGQGIANAVGLAIGERTLASQFNKPKLDIINHYTYVFLGDGCMMEGISHEACSLAGTMKLGKLIAFYDDNGISIDGNVKNWCNDDTAARFKSYGWNVINNIDGHDRNMIKSAIEEARSIKNQPSLLICKTIIAFGSPKKAGTNEAHGAPLGEEEIAATRKILGWNAPPFYISKEIYQAWNAKKLGQKKEKDWIEKFSIYEKSYPQLAKELNRRILGKLPENFKTNISKYLCYINNNSINIATRKASQNMLENLGPILPELFGGSADLSTSNLTTWSKSISLFQDHSGNYINYGVREFGMTAIGNGISLYGGFIPYTATFLVFVEYAKSAVRMAAMMKIRHIMIYTHDSIALGEDGATHQPIEQLSSLRMIPNMSIWRPCDQVETAVAWQQAIERNEGPTAIILSRHNLKQQDRTTEQLSNIARGGYILKDCIGSPELILISTGSEVELTMKAYQILKNEGYKVRIVSLPSTDVFDKQDECYREFVLPKHISKKIVIEAGVSDFWRKYVGLSGEIIGINNFGESAPMENLLEFFGFTVDNILNKAHKMMI